MATPVSCGDDLLGAQGDAGRLLGGQGQHLVHRVGVQALGPAEHAGQRLDGGADDVELGLLGGERDAGGLGVEPQLQRPGVGGPVAVGASSVAQMRRAARYLAISSKKSRWALKKKRQPGCELVDGEPGRQGRLDVGEPVGQGEGQLLGGRRSGFADVVARHRHRMEAGHLGRAEADDVGDQTHRRPRREDVLLLGLVLLQHVVLQGAAERARVGYPPLSAAATYMARSMAAGELMVIDVVVVAEVDAGEEVLGVGQGVDGHPATTHLTLG